MFKGASSFNQPLNAWNVSHVTDMNAMFSGATSYEHMYIVFTGTTSFNQPLNVWNVSH